MSKRCCTVAFNEQSECVIALKDQGEVKLLALQESAEALLNFTKKQHLSGTNTTCLLSSRDFQLFKVKKPTVPAAELKEALIWQEQSRFSEAVDQLAIEYFDCPSEPKQTGQRVFIFSTNQNNLKARFQTLDSAQLEVNDITTPGLSYGKYIQKQFPQQDLVVLCHLFKDLTQAQVFYQGALVEVARLPLYQPGNVKDVITSLSELLSNKLAAWEAEPLWVINSGLWNDEAISKKFTDGLTGEVRGLTHEQLDSLEQDRSCAFHHAVFGVLSHE